MFCDGKLRSSVRITHGIENFGFRCCANNKTGNWSCYLIVKGAAETFDARCFIFSLRALGRQV